MKINWIIELNISKNSIQEKSYICKSLSQIPGNFQTPVNTHKDTTNNKYIYTWHISIKKYTLIYKMIIVVSIWLTFKKMSQNKLTC